MLSSHLSILQNPPGAEEQYSAWLATYRVGEEIREKEGGNERKGQKRGGKEDREKRKEGRERRGKAGWGI